MSAVNNYKKAEIGRLLAEGWLDDAAELLDDPMWTDSLTDREEDQLRAAVYEAAGWQRCYHGRPDRLHFNIKVPFFDGDPRRLVDWRLRLATWMNGLGFTFKDVDFCGRSNGWVNVPRYSSNMTELISLAERLVREKKRFNSMRASEVLSTITAGGDSFTGPVTVWPGIKPRHVVLTVEDITGRDTLVRAEVSASDLVEAINAAVSTE